MAVFSNVPFSYKLLIMLTLGLMMIFGGYLIYNHFVREESEEHFNVVSEEGEEHPPMVTASKARVTPQYALYFFRASWCGHCTNFKPHWDKFVDIVSASDEMDHIQVVELDVDTVDGKEMTSKMGVSGFPTVLLVNLTNNDVSKYTGDRKCTGSAESECALLRFVKNSAPYIHA